MDIEFGDKQFPIWIMSDLEPSYMEDLLDGPYDYRHPVRHIICTSVFNIIQRELFKSIGRRMDEERFFYRNTIPQHAEKPKINDVIWSDAIIDEIKAIKKDIDTHKPFIVFTFGAYTFEVLRRVHERETAHSYGSWTPAEIGGAFKTHINDFDISQTNIIPLLDRSIMGWKFLESHEQFVGKKNADYFHFAGQKIAQLLVTYKDDMDIWL